MREQICGCWNFKSVKIFCFRRLKLKWLFMNRERSDDAETRRRRGERRVSWSSQQSCGGDISEELSSILILPAGMVPLVTSKKTTGVLRVRWMHVPLYSSVASWRHSSPLCSTLLLSTPSALALLEGTEQTPPVTLCSRWPLRSFSQLFFPFFN